MRITVRLMLIVSILAGWLVPGNASAHVDPNSFTGFAQTEPDVIYLAEDANVDLQTAINQVVDGGVIELAAGTYAAPSGGFAIVNTNKRFTIRGAAGASVAIYGGNATRLFRVENTPTTLQGSIVFQNLIFANGADAGVTYSAGVTVSNSDATFINCVFQNNNKTNTQNTTTGAGILAINGATVFVFNSVFQSNTSYDGAAALAARDARIFIHGSQFLNNRTIAAAADRMAAGGAIGIVNSLLRITNSRFENNQSAGHGGALYILGVWNTTGSDVIISNSLFKANQIVRTVGTGVPIEGGAINIEDNSLLKIYNSRFFANSAWIGGGVNIFRARAEIYNSAFHGNRATDPTATSGFGGAINFNFHDRPDAAYLLIEDSLIQGRYGSITSVAQFGGGLQVGGNLVANKPTVAIRRTVFNDLDVVSVSGKGSIGGAMGIAGANLILEDSFITNCDARSQYGGAGGAIVLYAYTNANITRTHFAQNTADTYGGAIYAQGAQINIADSTFLRNELSPGVNEGEYNSYGAAIFTTPETVAGVNVGGTISGSYFVSNTGMAIFDDDRSSGAYNNVVYNNNRFYETSFGDRAYHDSLSATMTASQLNGLVVSRTGSSTDKSPQNNNQALSNSPDIAKLIAVPNQVLSSAAAGEGGPTPSYLAYVWNGSSGRLDGSSLSQRAGVAQTTETGQHTLTADGVSANAQVARGATPALQIAVTPANPYPILGWSLTGGSFLGIYADQGLAAPSAPNAAVTMASNTMPVNLYAVTKEGGAVATAFPGGSTPGNRRVYLPLTLP